jgi:hypothetical protein
MKQAGKQFEVKIFPSFGSSVQDGHAFGYFGGSVWGNDVFRFLNQHCQQNCVFVGPSFQRSVKGTGGKRDADTLDEIVR